MSSRLFYWEVDILKCTQIETDLRASLDAADAPIVFDLAQMDFISSAFLRLRVHAYQRAGDHGLQIINVDPLVKRVFKIAGLDALLGVA
jgi:anti-anti-sigma factor